MRKPFYFLGLAAFLFAGLQLPSLTQAADAVSGSWTGEISSSNCETNHMPGMTARDCTQQCVDAGAAYVLIASGKVYGLADQRDKQLRAYAGETVKVTGELKGRVITVFKIER